MEFLAQILDISSSTKVIFFSVILICLGLTILLVSKMRKITGPGPVKTAESSPLPQSPLMARWEEITRHINSPKEAEWKFAVIEADNLTNDILRKRDFAGETMGDILTNIQPGQLITLEELWEAHKIRNKIAHDNGYFLRYAEAKRAVNQFEKTLKELGVLD